MQGQGQVGVFCNRIRIEAAGFVYCFPAECADCSGDDGDRIDAIVGAAVEVEAADVLEALEARNPCLQVADPGVSGYGADARISERLNQKTQRVGLKLCVGVKEDDDLVGGRGQASREGARFSAVGLSQYA